MTEEIVLVTVSLILMCVAAYLDVKDQRKGQSK